jgi:ubiquinone/menaquinone biosynthesis C-methylase UbiE
MIETAGFMSTTKLDGVEFWKDNPCGGQWRNYRDFMAWIQTTEPYVFSVIDSYEWQGRKVLEVGCGQGPLLNYIPSHGGKMFGMDMSMTSVLDARAGAIELGCESEVVLLQSDAERLPFAGNVYDIVLSIGVLHHTEDTGGAVREIHRLLKPGGQAIVMLYRSGNPKWWMTSLFRGYSWLVDAIAGKKYVIASRLRARQQAGSASGTALLELFGVPVLKAFSNTQSKRMFSQFSEVKITNYSPGFSRMADILPLLRMFKPVLKWLDDVTQETWGFYQVIEAKK